MKTNQTTAATISGVKKYLLPVLAVACGVSLMLWQGKGQNEPEVPVNLARTSFENDASFLGEAAERMGEHASAAQAVTGDVEAEKLSVWQAYQKAAHEVQQADGVAMERAENLGVRFFASNPGQHITARFLEEGVRLQSGTSTPWQASVRAAAVGRGAELVALPGKAVPQAAGDTVSYEHAALTEWYVNKPEGIEQGFTLASRPEGPAEAELRVDVSVQGLSAKNEGGGIVLQDAQGGHVLGYDKLKVWDAKGAELPARMTGQGDKISIFVADAGAVYPVTIDPLFTSYVGKLEIGELECGRPGDLLGHAVGVWGDLAAVGAPGDDSLLGTDVGAAYVFERIEGVWTLAAKLKGADGANGDRLGGALAVGDGMVLVGARLADLKNKVDAGAVYAFAKRLGMWVQTAKLTAKDSAAGAWFGESIAMEGGTAVIGAPSHLGDRGAAYLFTRRGVSWKQAERLLATGGVAGDRFGDAVDVKGTTVLVGAPQQAGKGAAYVFDFNGTVGSQRQMLSAGDGVAADFFGAAVSLASDSAVIGAPGRAMSTGAAYLFTRSGTTWAQAQVLSAGDAAVGDLFGISLAQYGRMALIGAPGADMNGTLNRGAAYVFSPETTSAWVQQTKLSAPSGVENDGFGGAVALHLTTAVVGAHQADANGWNGDTVVDLGCAHVFTVLASAVQEIAVRVVGKDQPEEDQPEILSGSTLNFGNVFVGLTSSRTFVLRNLGNQPLTGLRAAISGANANQFRIVKLPPSALLPGQAFEMVMIFAPTSPLEKLASLRITSSDANEGSLDVNLVGVGEEASRPEIMGDPEDLIVALGAQARFQVQVAGEPAPGLAWRRNGRNLKNKTASTLSFRAALADAGNYDVVAKSRGGTVTSRAAALAVVDTSETRLFLPTGGRATMRVIASGANLSFSWIKGASPVIQDGRVSISSDGRTLTIQNLQESTDNGLYRCVVSGPGGSLFGGIHTLTVLTDRPQFSEFSLPAGRVSCPYQFSVPVNSATGRTPTRFSATGLPRNLVIDPDTGRISGTPVGPGDTSHAVRITATNAMGSTSVDTSIFIHALPCGVVGKFKGVIERDGGMNGGFGGMIDMEVNSSGSISGSLTLGADKYPFTSALICPSQSEGAFGSITVARKGLSALSLSFRIQLSTGMLSGTILDAGNLIWSFKAAAGANFQSGSVDGVGVAARFNCPYGLARDKAGNVYVADSANHVIRRMSPTGQVVTFAGVAGLSGLANGCESEVRFNSPMGVACDARGFLYVADTGNRVVRKVTPEGKVTTLAGSGSSGSADGSGANASFIAPIGIAIGSDGSIYVTDAEAHTVRRISAEGVVSTLAGKAGVAGAKNGTAAGAEFYGPRGVVEVRPGILVVADTSNNCLRQVIVKSRVVSTFAGGLGVGGRADGKAVNARFGFPTGITADAAGNVYVTDTGNGTVRRVSPQMIVTTLTDSCECDDRGPGVVRSFETQDYQDGPYGCCQPCFPTTPFYQPVGIVLNGKNMIVSDCYMHVLLTGAAESACEVEFEAWRNPWGTDAWPQSQAKVASMVETPYPCINPPASAFAGTYNFILDPCMEYDDSPGYNVSSVVIGHSSAPAGNGFGSLTVSNNGTVTCAATLADGTTVTGSSILGGVYFSGSGQVPLFFMLYKNTGSIQGMHVISQGYEINGGHQAQTPSVMNNSVNGCMDWMKISQLPPAGKNYPQGFELHGLRVIGEKYDASSYANLVGSFFGSGSNNAMLEFFMGGLSPEIMKVFTFNANSTATMPDSTVSFSFNKANGRFSGNFKHGSPQKTTLYQGVYLRRISSGAGFFLHDLGSSILSGQAYFGSNYNSAE